MRIPRNIQHGHRAAFALLVAAIVAGCSDDSDTVVGPAPRAARTPDAADRPSAPLRAGSRGATENLAAQAWFDISIKANGTFKPRTRIDVAVTYTARFAASEADFRLTLPEIEFARRSGWTETYKTTLERKIPAVVESSGAVTAGAVETQTTALEIPAPGVYRVHASARVADLHPTGASGRVARVNHEYLWLFVHDDGGRVLRDFDPALLPPGFRRQPGPARRLNPPPPPSRPAKDGAAGLASSSAIGECGSRELCFQVQYYDLDFTDQRRLPGVPYELDLQTPSGSILGSYAGRSSDTGDFVIPCPGSAGTEFVGRGRLGLSDDKLEILPEPDMGFVASDDLCGRTIDLHVPGAEAKTWINAQYSIEESRGLFPARTAITVRINPDAVHPGHINSCWYLPYSDEITVIEGRGGDPKCLWGRWGSFVFAHEYGHALHHARLGGLYDLDDDCAEHHAYTEESMVCAYQEGWADYHALRTEPAYNTPGYHYNSAEDYENNRGVKYDSEGNVSYVEFTPKPDSNVGRADGSRYHGEITAVFYDLFDPANETHDLLELDISTVMDVMASCRVSRDTVTAAPSGIDHLIWCLEARVDTTITRDTTYFQQRTKPPENWVPPKNFHPTAQNQDSLPWSSNHVRRLWRGNLYRLGDSTDLERPALPDSSPSRIDTPDPGSPPLPPVTNEPPAAHLVVTCEVPTCLFDGSESSDDAGITSYTWYANAVVLASGNSDTLRHRFAKPGEYFITLSVEDEQGRWASVTRPDTTIKVPDYAPTAGLVVECSELDCTFDGSGSTDDVGITSYAWHVDGDSVAVDTVSTRNHVFDAQGTYAVKLTVADSASQTDTTTVTVNVQENDPGSDIATACGGPDCVPDADSLQARGIATRGWTPDRRDVARHFARGRRARQRDP